MKKQKKIRYVLLFSCLWICLLQGCKGEKIKNPDILVVGGGTSGVSAGIASARQGVATLIIENSTWLGGMLTGAGVSAVDGNYRLPSGFWGEFKDSLACHYGAVDSLKTGWVSNVLFEPSVGNKILQQIASREKQLTILLNSRVQSISNDNGKWTVTVGTPQGTVTLHPSIVIDATELGDIARLCGVPYDIGMESRQITGESVAPEKSNEVIQDLTYVAILKDYKKEVAISRPENYDPEEFACSCKNKYCKNPDPHRVLWDKEKMITYGRLPNNKYMINWPISGNDFYLNVIEKTEEERGKAFEEAKKRTLRFLYFIQNELGMNTLGLADDEFPTADKLPFIPYHRESLRIHGLVRFTLNHIVAPYSQPEKLYRTSIAVGDYPVDHHHGRYSNPDQLPELHFHPVPSYGLPLGTLIPQKTKGLIVAEKSISVSNIVNGTTRLQPVVLQIGQAAGILAAVAVKEKKEIEAVSVRTIQRILLSQGGYLLPYLDVEKKDPLFLPLQRIGATGILQGFGKNEGWANQTWFRVNDPLLWSELQGLKAVYPTVELLEIAMPVTQKELFALIRRIAAKEPSSTEKEQFDKIKEIFSTFKFTFAPEKTMTRAEAAVLIDRILEPFDKEITIQGHYK